MAKEQFLAEGGKESWIKPWTWTGKRWAFVAGGSLLAFAVLG
jgi:hypothetical protein